MDTQTKSGFPSEPARVVTSPPGGGHHPPPYAGGPQPAPAPVMGINVMPLMGGAIIITEQMGPKPSRVVCKSCHQEVTTTTKPKASLRTHLIAAVLCLTFLWPCVCIPYCVDSCMNTEHYCPNCNSYIGAHVN